MSQKVKAILKPVALIIVGILLGTFINFQSIFTAIRYTIHPVKSNASLGKPARGGHFEWYCYHGMGPFGQINSSCVLMLLWISN